MSCGLYEPRSSGSWIRFEVTEPNRISERLPKNRVQIEPKVESM
jgi:hypothetical protein